MSPAATRYRARPLSCPQCRAEVAWVSVSEASRVATCRVCHRVFELTGRHLTGSALERKRPVAPRLKVEKPDVAQVTERPGGVLEVVAREQPVYRVSAAMFSAAGVLVAGTAAFFPAIWAGRNWIPTLFAGTVLAVVTVVNGWRLVASYVNRLEVVLRAGELSARRRPLWMPGRRRYAPGQLRQLFVEEGRRYDLEGEDLGAVYALKGILAGSGKRVTVVPNIDDLELALWLEQHLERALRITDRPVKGELRSELGR